MLARARGDQRRRFFLSRNREPNSPFETYYNQPAGGMTRAAEAALNGSATGHVGDERGGDTA